MQKSAGTLIVLALLSIVILPVAALADCPALKASAATPHHPCCPKPKPAVPLPTECFAGCLNVAVEPVQLHAHMRLMGIDATPPVPILSHEPRGLVESLSPMDALFPRRELYILLRVLRR